MAEWGDKMYTVYVLRSLINGRRYIGYTSKQPFKRLEEHNTNCSKWTKKNKPFKLVYTEEFILKTEAVKREKYLKSGQGRRFLGKIVSVD